LWHSFGEQYGNLYHWMRASGQFASIADPSAKSGSQGELQ